MGNTASSKDRHDDTVDFGSLCPQGVYTGPQDWNHTVVAQAIVDRKLAPFYRPLEDYEDNWDDERILAARKDLPPPQIPPQLQQPGNPQQPQTPTALEHTAIHPSVTRSSISSKSHKAAGKEPLRMSEAKVYKGAVECPICFLYYPPNINHSRCCDQAICTECFVQIKRIEPTTTHIVSEPACCPYCVQENFGVVYTPPSWRAGIGSDGAPINIAKLDPSRPGSSSGEIAGASEAVKSRRKSASHTSSEVVTVDQIRPDWEAKLNAVRAAVARRANRRIIMRQVGDRLIPVGVTSGRVHPIGEAASATNGEGSGEGNGEGRRSRRRHQNNNPGGEIGQLLNSMGLGLGGQDLEEMLLQEAMRLSLIEHEAEQRRQRDQQQNGDSSASDQANNESPAGGISRSVPEASNIASRHSSSPSVSSTASGSPRRRSHIPAVPSPLGSTTAAIAMAIGLPQTGGDTSSYHRNGSSGHLAPPPAATTASSRSASHSRSRSSSSTSANVFSSTLAAAVTGATSTASAFLGSSGPEATSNENDARRERSPIPELPIVVSPSILQGDIMSASADAEGSPSLSPSPSPSAGEQESLPRRVQGVAETAVDIPTPGGHVPVVAFTPSPPQEQAEETAITATTASSSIKDSPPLATPAASTSANLREPTFMLTRTRVGEEDDDDTDSVSLATGEGAETGFKEPYRVLPSTPDLMASAPLLPNDSASSSLDTTNGLEASTSFGTSDDTSETEMTGSISRKPIIG